MSDETKSRKVIGRTVAVVLGLVCIILAAGLVAVGTLYLQVMNTNKTLNTEVAGLKGNMTALLQQVSDLQSQLSQLSAKDATITQLRASIDELNDVILGYENILYLNASDLLTQVTFTVDANTTTTVFDDQLFYAGYVSVQVTSSHDSTYVQMVYSSFGVNYDNAIIVGTNGTAIFPVLPGLVEIRLGNSLATEAISGTVLAIYRY